MTLPTPVLRPAAQAAALAKLEQAKKVKADLEFLLQDTCRKAVAVWSTGMVDPLKLTAVATDLENYLVIFTDGELHLSVHDNGEIHLVIFGEDMEWTRIGGPLADLCDLDARLAEMSD